MRTRTRRLNSAVHIARLLDCEGFTDHTASVITKFAKRCMTERQMYKYKRLKKAMGKLCEGMSESDKLALGRFIGLQKAISFQTGMKMGLAAAIVTKPINIRDVLEDDEIPAPPKQAGIPIAGTPYDPSTGVGS